MKFFKEEDASLKKGLRCDGFGHWTAMIKDKELTFQRGRKTDLIKKRAISKFPSLCSKTHN